MNALIIGFGSIGRRHFNLLKNNKQIDDVHIVSRYEVGEMVISDSIAELSPLQLSTYDVFFICSETALHEPQLIEIDQQVQGKIIVVEKPLFSSVSNYVPANLVLVAYNLRFHPVIEYLSELVLNEKLLSVSITAGQYLPTWRPGQNYKNNYSYDLHRGGGVLRDLSHELDYACLLCGELKVISAIASSISHLNINADDICTILASNRKGVHIQIQMDYLSFRPKREIEIQTEDKTIVANMVQNSINIYRSDGSLETLEFGECERDLTYKKMHDNLLNFDGNKLSSFENASNVMKIIDLVTNNYMDKSWV